MGGRLHLEYSILEDEHKMFETCSGQEELNYTITLKSSFCWLTLHKQKTETQNRKHDVILQIHQS